MEFGWTDTQEALYAETVAQVRTCIAPLIEARGVEHQFSRDEWHACAAAGLLGLGVPQALGGRGLGWVSSARAIEAFGYASEDAGLPFAAAAHLLAVAIPIAEFGSHELQRELLPGMCAGELVGANAITEAGSGSDVFALQTTAVRDGDDYILTGTKTYVSNGPIADIVLAYATINPRHGFLGVTAFAVDAHAPGIRQEPGFEKTGLRSVPVSVMHFEGCRVPARRRVGQDGQGGSIFNRSMLWERACLVAAFLGVMERQLERAVTFAKQRRQFRAPLAQFQAVSHEIVGMKLRLEASRLLLYRGCWLAERGEPAAAEVSMAKLSVTESAIRLGVEGTQLLGGFGIQGGAGMERAGRDALAASIASGTANMQRQIIANGLGL